MSMKTIRFERDGAVGRIVLANPPFNRLDSHFSIHLREAVQAVSLSDVRVLVIVAEGPHFSFGGEVREWSDKDLNWFRTTVGEVNMSYRAIEALRIPTVASARGMVFGGGFELALNCDFIVAAEDAIFRCVEVTTGMLPIAGGLQRLCERVGRARASRYAMLGAPISGVEAVKLGIASHVVPESQLDPATAALAQHLANGPTRSYAATRTLLKAWSSGGVPLADAMMLDVTMDLYTSEDAKRGFVNTAKAFDQNIEPPPIIFNGR
jgi:enoyl-CoA hydratase/carnithine racemase